VLQQASHTSTKQAHDTNSVAGIAAAQSDEGNATKTMRVIHQLCMQNLHMPIWLQFSSRADEEREASNG